METQEAGRVVLFDGLCGFCSTSVRFILKRDRGRHFTFAPQQSQAGMAMMGKCDLESDILDTLVLVDAGRCWTRSTAALKIVRSLSGAWPLLYALILVPRPLRDFFYDAFARNRYRWFGRNPSCFAPPPDQQERFLN
jgi:predicted DCC family thiol-disulfide oxidoreductase YuxK